MNILIINNGTKHINELKTILATHNVKVINFNERLIEYKNYDLIILSGSSKLSVINHTVEYSDEINLIKKSNVPIVGICLGFELICFAFSEKLVLLNNKRHSLLRVHKIKEDSIFKEIKNHFWVYDAHRWGVKNTLYLISLAKSKDGVEIIKHPIKKIYGLQFHPEVFKAKSKGYKLLNNIINNI